MKYAVWVRQDALDGNDEPHYHVMKIEHVKSAADVPLDVPRDAIVIEANTNGEVLDRFIECLHAAAIEG